MSGLVRWILVLVVSSGGVAVVAQPPLPRPEDGEADVREGLFFTDRIIDRAINRVTEDLAEHYGLDEDQLYNTRAIVKERFPRFFQENRAQLIRIANRWMEVMLADEPPTPEEVAEWAQLVTPLLGQFAGLVEETAQDMRSFMTDEQQVKLDGELAMFRVGLDYANRRLQVWANGGYDWEAEWPRSEKFREKEWERARELEREQRRARAEAMGLDPNSVDGGSAGDGGVTRENPPTHPTSQPDRTDDWAAYVENFIRRYKLDETQKTAAYKLLRRAQEDRERYLRRKLADIEAVEKRLREAKTDEERARAKADYERLNEPLDCYFRRLKDGLETLPTRRQRAEAAKADMEAKAQATPKPPPKNE